MPDTSQVNGHQIDIKASAPQRKDRGATESRIIGESREAEEQMFITGRVETAYFSGRRYRRIHSSYPTWLVLENGKGGSDRWVQVPQGDADRLERVYRENAID